MENAFTGVWDSKSSFRMLEKLIELTNSPDWTQRRDVVASNQTRSTRRSSGVKTTFIEISR